MALNITKVKPLFTSIVTTMNRYEDDVKVGSLIDSSKTKGTLKEYQKVLSVGSMVKEVKEGDWVMINPQRYANVTHKAKPKSLANDIQRDTTTITYSFDIVTINGEDCLLLQDRDVMYVFEGDEVPDKPASTLIVPENKIIL